MEINRWLREGKRSGKIKNASFKHFLARKTRRNNGEKKEEKGKKKRRKKEDRKSRSEYRILRKSSVFKWRLTGGCGRVNDLEKPSPGLADRM